MQTALLVLHLMIAATLVVVVLFQQSEGGALGMGGGGGGGGFMSGRGTANLLTRVTAALALAFFCTSIALTILANKNTGGSAPGLKTLIPPTTSGAPVAGKPASGSAGTPAPAAPAGGGGVFDSLKKGVGPVPKIPQGQ